MDPKAVPNIYIYPTKYILETILIENKKNGNKKRYYKSRHNLTTSEEKCDATAVFLGLNILAILDSHEEVSGYKRMSMRCVMTVLFLRVRRGTLFLGSLSAASVHSCTVRTHPLNPQGSSTAIFHIAEVISSSSPGGSISFWFSADMPSCNNWRTWVRVMWKEGAVASRPGLNT